MANFNVLAARKLGREHFFFALSFFCSRPNFRAAKTSKFDKETLATQAKQLVTTCFACAWPHHLSKRDGKVLILMETVGTPEMGEVECRQ